MECVVGLSSLEFGVDCGENEDYFISFEDRFILTFKAKNFSLVAAWNIVEVK